MFDDFEDEEEGFDDLFDEVNIEAALKKYEDFKNNESVYFTEDDIENLSYHFLLQGKKTEQLEIIEHGLTLYPSNVELIIEKAEIYWKNKDIGTALELLNNAKSIAPYEALIYNIEGLILTDIDSFEESEAAFKIALLHADEDFLVEVYVNYAQMLCQNNENDKANRLIEKALKQFNENEMLFTQLGLNFIANGTYTAAITYFKNRTDIEPYSYNTWLQLGRFYEINGNQDEALNAYEYSGLVNKNSKNAFFSQASIYESKEEYLKAIENYKLCKKNEGDVYPDLCIARCYLALSDSEMARLHLKNSKSLGDFLPEYQYLLGYSFLVDEQPFKALPYFKRLVKDDPEDFASQKALITCYADLGKLTELITAYKKIRKQNKELFIEHWKDFASIFFHSELAELFDELMLEIENLSAYENEFDAVQQIIKYTHSPSMKNKELIVKFLIKDYDDTVESVKLFCPNLFFEDEYFKLNLQLYNTDNNNEQRNF